MELKELNTQVSELEISKLLNVEGMPQDGKDIIRKMAFELGKLRTAEKAQMEIQSDNSGKRLLMMFIRDSYATRTGKPTKKTAIALMRYVASDADLQKLINMSDYKAVLNHEAI